MRTEYVYLKNGETSNSADWETKFGENGSQPKAANYFKEPVLYQGGNYKFLRKEVKNYNIVVAIFRGLLGVALTIPLGIGWWINDEFMCSLFSRRKAKRYVFEEIPTPLPPPVTTAKKADQVAAGHLGKDGNTKPPGAANPDSPVGEVTEPIARSPVSAKKVDHDKPDFTKSFDTISTELLSKQNEFESLTGSLGTLEKSFSKSKAIALKRKFNALKSNGNVIVLQKILEEKFLSHPAEELETIKKTIQPLIDAYVKFHERIDERVKSVDLLISVNTGRIQTQVAPRIPGKTTGIQNRGNTCYLNAALQVLFANPEFIQNLPQELSQTAGESPERFAARKKVYGIFKELVEEWKSDLKTPESLGKLVHQYRQELYKNKDLLGFFDINKSEGYMNSAGDFFRHFFTVMILKGIKVNFTVDNTSVTDENVRVTRIDTVDTFDLKAPGNIQQKANAHEIGFFEDVTAENPRTIEGKKIKSFKQEIKIEGEPPQFLIVYVDTDMNRKYSVNIATDEEVDFSKIFGNPPVNGRYRLVGFAQNHGNVHWTAVVRTKENKWDYCDDSRTSEIKPESGDFKRAASYMVYQKI